MNQKAKPLFILGLPKSGSTFLYHSCAKILGHQINHFFNPKSLKLEHLALFGEIAFANGTSANSLGSVKYVHNKLVSRYAWTKEYKEQIYNILDEAIDRYGNIIIKEVQNIPIVIDYIIDHEYPTLLKYQDPALVTMLLQKTGWGRVTNYFGKKQNLNTIASSTNYVYTKLFHSLETKYSFIKGITQDELIEDESVLLSKLESLDFPIINQSYLSKSDIEKSKDRKKYLTSSDYLQASLALKQSKNFPLTPSPKPSGPLTTQKYQYIRFEHNLADCCNFIHLLHAYRQIGHEYTILTSEHQIKLFESFNFKATSTEPEDPSLVYSHPWKYGDWITGDDGQLKDIHKCNVSLLNYNTQGVPEAISKDRLWSFCKHNFPKCNNNLIKNSDVKNLTANLPRPIFVLHAEDDNYSSANNLKDPFLRQLARKLVDSSGGSVVLYRLSGSDTFLVGDHYKDTHYDFGWNKNNLNQLASLIDLSDLFIGINGGPFNFARLLRKKSVGLWTKGHPAKFMLPSELSFNICIDHPPNPSPRSMVYDLELQIMRHTNAKDIANRCISLVEDKGYLGYLIDLCDGGIKLPHRVIVDRHRSFQYIFDHLNKHKKHPIIFETGCIRAPYDFSGAGMFGFLASFYCYQNNGLLISVDIDKNKCAFAEETTAFAEDKGRVVIRSDSVDFLTHYKCGIDILYLDSKDVGVEGYEDHCLAEGLAALPKMNKNALIVIDDTWKTRDGYHGKGSRLIPNLLQNGWKLNFSGYQVILSQESKQT
ncbi:MAG: hypothetical protein HQL32_03690 [Planctomycetes bacterium]|nr:hypothetical protein [Planctomycetota bacterium]